jgi:ATP-binding cassette, subfamily B, bacterial PglK
MTNLKEILNKREIFLIFDRLMALLTKNEKTALLLFVVFSILISLIEMISISMIMPFMAIATDFSVIQSNLSFSIVYNFFSFKSEVDFVIFFGVFLVIFFLFRSAISVVYFYTLNKFVQGCYHSLSCKLLENYMHLPYKEFIKINSSVMTKAIISEIQNLTKFIGAILFMMSEVFVVLFLYAVLLYVSYEITLSISIAILISMFIMSKTISKNIKVAGVLREDAQRGFYEVLNKSFGNFKMIKLYGNSKEILRSFSTHSSVFARSNVVNETLVQIPRLFLEAIGFGSIAFIVTYIVWEGQGNILNSLPVLSLFVLSLFRLMPSVNRILTSYNQILFLKKSLNIIYKDFMRSPERLGDSSVQFNKDIEVRGVNFSYESGKTVFKNICLMIKKGERVAFIGKSGSGKSTMADIIMGLNVPNKGEIFSDGVSINNSNIASWRSKFGYISQSIYLFDGTVADNIVFNSSYNPSKIDDILKKVKMYDFLLTKNGRDTLVGENGVMLSGGQKQRVAIARALYKDPEILVLDEATSSLDEEVESEIMDEIYKLSKDRTLIIIAHKLSTIDRCEKVFEIKNGVITNNLLKRK